MRELPHLLHSERDPNAGQVVAGEAGVGKREVLGDSDGKLLGGVGYGQAS